MTILSLEDLRDVYLKIVQRGRKFVFSKFSFSDEKRTKSSFNNTEINSAMWWIVPAVKARWNYLISGNPEINYEHYFSTKYKSERPLKMVSIGSGICSHELVFAKLNPNWEITCIDFSEQLLQAAQEKAKKENLHNIRFLAQDIYKYDLGKNYYDLVLFHSSLHHFKNLDDFLKKIYRSMAVGAKLIINEFVGANRLQYSSAQLIAINQCLQLIEPEYRKLFRTNLHKNKYYGSGILRMIISDPSECVESENILPFINRYFNTLEEKAYGGNLLMPVLKDIAHHFVMLDAKNKACLERIFEFEDEYLKRNKSDFLFGVYEKSAPIS